MIRNVTRNLWPIVDFQFFKLEEIVRFASVVNGHRIDDGEWC